LFIHYLGFTFKVLLISFFCLIKKRSKKNQEIVKAIAMNCDRQSKAKMSPRLQHLLTLLFGFAAPIS
jgi:hypothetical protein